MCEHVDEGEIVVLTGASGCLGYHTLKLLIGHDDKVKEIRCLDVREPGSEMKDLIEVELEKFENQPKSGGKIRTKKEIKWIKGDIRDINIVEQTLIGAHCIIHCAARIEFWTENSEQDLNELESVNVCGTENLLKASIRLGVYKFIHVSSFEAYAGYETLYYCTEATLPDTKCFLFGASGSTKKEAERRVKQYSNRKLSMQVSEGKDSLNAVIVRFAPMYGEFDRYFVSKIIEITKFFGGTLQRMDNIWIRQQPIYAGNAAWSLIRAKHRMDHDQSISGEEFHITDETPIEDPFTFVEPFLQCKGMEVSKSSYPALVIWLLLVLFYALKRFFTIIDFLGLLTSKKDRVQEAIEQDRMKADNNLKTSSLSGKEKSAPRWYKYITPQTFWYMCNTSFLNRTKASLRLDYEPLVNPEESKQRSLEWYKNQLKL